MVGPLKTKDIIKPKKIIKVEPKRGLYLTEPHARLIATGKKTLIIQEKKFNVKSTEAFYLLENSVCWGYIWLGIPIEIGPKDFKALAEKHLVSDEERKKWFGDKFPLYSYNVKVQAWAHPEIVKVPQRVQVFVDAKNLKFKKIKILNNKELEIFHAWAHVLKHLDLHETLKEEFNARKLFHPYSDWLDRIHEFLIADWKTYSAMELIKTKRGRKILADDHRIVHAWWKILQKGKKMESEQFKDYSLTKQKEIVWKLHKKIVKAFKTLKWEHDSPLKTKSSLSFSLEELQNPKPKISGIRTAWIEIVEINYKNHTLRGLMLCKDDKFQGVWKLVATAENRLRVIFEDSELKCLKAIKVWINEGDILDIVDHI